MAIQPAYFEGTADLATVSTFGHQASSTSIWQRLRAWYMAKLNAERDAEIAAFVEERGGQFTDDLEREISRRFGGHAG